MALRMAVMVSQGPWRWAWGFGEFIALGAQALEDDLAEFGGVGGGEAGGVFGGELREFLLDGGGGHLEEGGAGGVGEALGLDLGGDGLAEVFAEEAAADSGEAAEEDPVAEGFLTGTCSSLRARV
ncbi:MAG: hypothetical protein WDN28_03505 [Chthoniobacter sp.]